MAHVSALADGIGPREEGTAGEDRAMQYIQGQLTSLGYSPTVQQVPVESGSGVSHNVIARLDGTQKPQFKVVVGAHVDTKGGPGANDNASGCAAVLELARVLKSNGGAVPTVEFAFFGGEEIPPGHGGNDHHFGSRYFCSSDEMRSAGSVIGMISVDMIGYGSRFHARDMRAASQMMTDFFLDYGRAAGLSYLADDSSYGMSDHEAFERAGVSSTWIEWRNDEAIHGPGDTTAHLDQGCLTTAGNLLTGFFSQYLTPERVDALAATAPR